LLIWRAGGELLFASIERRRGTEDCTGRKPFTSEARACGGGAVNFIDTSACDALLHSIKGLQSQGMTLAFVCVRDEMRERMRLSGIEAVIGCTNFCDRVTDGVRAWQKKERLGHLKEPKEPAAAGRFDRQRQRSPTGPPTPGDIRNGTRRRYFP